MWKKIVEIIVKIIIRQIFVHLSITTFSLSKKGRKKYYQIKAKITESQ